MVLAAEAQEEVVPELIDDNRQDQPGFLRRIRRGSYPDYGYYKKTKGDSCFAGQYIPRKTLETGKLDAPPK
jgi:hypothetical protein